MRIYFRVQQRIIDISKKVFKLSLVILGLSVLVYLPYFVYEQYIVYKTEKTFNMLNEAYQKTVETSNLQWEKGKMNTEILASAFLKNLPVKKNCEYTNDGTCFAKQVYFTKESRPVVGVSIRPLLSHKVLLKDGTAIAFRHLSPNCDMIDNICGEIYIDANGPFKGPNRFSRDIFDFSILKDKLEPYDIIGNHFPNCVYGGGQCCGAYLFKFRNRNYKSYRNYVKRHHIEHVNFDTGY